MTEHSRIEVLLSQGAAQCQGSLSGASFPLCGDSETQASFILWATFLQAWVLYVQPAERKVRVEKAHLLDHLGQMRHTSLPLIFHCWTLVTWLHQEGWWGLPWWRSGWESACQCRGHGFEPWSGKIPHATEHLGPWATVTEPARLEPVLRNERGRGSERPTHRDEEWPPLAATGGSPRTETKTQHSHK